MKPRPVTYLVMLVITSGVTIFAQATQDPGFAQPQAPPDFQSQQPAQAAQLLSPDQLMNLVAPVALYPDPLLSEVLAASTYPLEVVQAQQWLQQNSNLSGQELMDAAKQQNWDPSVEALVAFPDVLARMNGDVQWTTALGNAFLAQQNDVMNAIQQMRVRAQQNGRLNSTPQQVVTNQTENGQDAVVIEPANPQVIYVPQYNPAYIWGPPEYGYYPALYYPSFGFGFGPGCFLSAFFPSWGFGWGGWGLGWGWGFGWFGHGLFVNHGFFNQYGFHGYGYAGNGRGVWEHDAFHREGVGYGNAAVAARYNNARFSEGRFNAGARNFANEGNARSFGNNGRGFSGNTGAINNGRGFSGNTGAANNGRAFSGNTGTANYGRGFSGNTGTANYGRGFSGNTGTANYGRGFSGNTGVANNGRAFSGNTGTANYGRGFSGNTGVANNGRAFSGNAGTANYGRGFSGNTSAQNSRAFSGSAFNNTPRTSAVAPRSYSNGFGGVNRSFSSPSGNAVHSNSGGGFSGRSFSSAGSSHASSGGGHASGGGGGHGHR